MHTGEFEVIYRQPDTPPPVWEQKKFNTAVLRLAEVELADDHLIGDTIAGWQEPPLVWDRELAEHYTKVMPILPGDDVRLDGRPECPDYAFIHRAPRINAFLRKLLLGKRGDTPRPDAGIGITDPASRRPSNRRDFRAMQRPPRDDSYTDS